jgi:hypothetical protein
LRNDLFGELTAAIVALPQLLPLALPLVPGPLPHMRSRFESARMHHMSRLPH